MIRGYFAALPPETGCPAAVGLSAGSHSPEVDIVDADAAGFPIVGRRGPSPCLLLGLEHDEREPASVDRL
jgi:hypothetical protein